MRWKPALLAAQRATPSADTMPTRVKLHHRRKSLGSRAPERIFAPVYMQPSITHRRIQELPCSSIPVCSPHLICTPTVHSPAGTKSRQLHGSSRVLQSLA